MHKLKKNIAKNSRLTLFQRTIVDFVMKRLGSINVKYALPVLSSKTDKTGSLPKNSRWTTLCRVLIHDGNFRFLSDMFFFGINKYVEITFKP